MEIIRPELPHIFLNTQELHIIGSSQPNLYPEDPYRVIAVLEGRVAPRMAAAIRREHGFLINGLWSSVLGISDRVPTLALSLEGIDREGRTKRDMRARGGYNPLTGEFEEVEGLTARELTKMLHDKLREIESSSATARFFLR